MYPPWNSRSPWKWMVGILVSFWDGLFSGAVLVSGRVCFFWEDLFFFFSGKIYCNSFVWKIYGWRISEFRKSFLMVCKGGASESFNKKQQFFFSPGVDPEKTGWMLANGPIQQGNDILRDQLVGAMLYFLIMMIMAKVYGMLGGGFKVFFKMSIPIWGNHPKWLLLFFRCVGKKPTN